jgi:hypothetical protein
MCTIFLKIAVIATSKRAPAKLAGSILIWDKKFSADKTIFTKFFRWIKILHPLRVHFTIYRRKAVGYQWPFLWVL